MDIYKAGGVLIRDRKLLVGRSQGKKHFIAPGGTVEPGETVTAALIRELQEEFTVEVKDSELEELATFYAPAASDPSKKLQMDVYLVKSWNGDLTPSCEVGEMAWIGSNIPAGMSVGSIFEHDVIPLLKKLDLID